MENYGAIQVYLYRHRKRSENEGPGQETNSLIHYLILAFQSKSLTWPLSTQPIKSLHLSMQRRLSGARRDLFIAED